MNEAVRLSGVDLIQLHGDEDDAYMAQMAVPVIKAMHISTEGAGSEEGLLLQRAQALSGKALGLLFDSKLPGASSSGGSGKVFDWSLVGHNLTILYL